MLSDFFVASSDALAASVLDEGPAAGFPVVADTGVIPPVQTDRLEGLLTGRSYEGIARRKSPDLVATRNDGEVMVQRLPDELLDALAATSEENLAEVAVLWSRTEEFMGWAEPETLAEILLELAQLARHGQATGGHLYCWSSV